MPILWNTAKHSTHFMKQERAINQTEKKSICSWLTKEIKHTNKNKKLKGQDLQCELYEILFHKACNKQIKQKLPPQNNRKVKGKGCN